MVKCANVDYATLSFWMLVALHVPFNRIWLEDSGLAEKAVLCAIMTITAGVSCGVLECFGFLFFCLFAI